LAHLSILSFFHTVFSAIADFFRSITLTDILNALEFVLRGIFIRFPHLIWEGIKSLGRGAEYLLLLIFGSLYELVRFIVWCLTWIVLYLPKKIWGILGSVFGGIAKAFHELWVFISPKSMG
jgi:hypothetical protein